MVTYPLPPTSIIENFHDKNVPQPKPYQPTKTLPLKVIPTTMQNMLYIKYDIFT